MAEKGSHSAWNRVPLRPCHTVKLNQNAMKVIQSRGFAGGDLEQRQLESLVQISHPI